VFTGKRDQQWCWHATYCSLLSMSLILEYNSKPDTFNLSQSWGWKSNTLCLDEKKETNEEEDESKDVIRFTVALGNV
jgi:hypothetical protein